MGQGYSQPTPGQGAIDQPELADLITEKELGGRFLRTIRARQRNGLVIAKLCVKPSPAISFKAYVRQLRSERDKLRDVSNVLPYTRVRETATSGLLVRQYIHSSLYDRVSIRPFLETIEKKWIAFQLLCAVRDCHAQGVFHGDIKSENVLVTSWNWVYLTDFSSAFKPVYLPDDDPANFTTYFDTSARRTCCVAPERFLAPAKRPAEALVQWNMDIFSLGCVLAELFTESPTFNLSQLFKYRVGEYDPTLLLLNKINDEHVRSLISSMIRLNPEERWHAQDYLDEYKNKAFPLYFYQHFHVLMQDIADPTAGRTPVTVSNVNNGECDDRIDKIYEDFQMLSVSLGYPPNAAKHPPSNKTGQFANLFPMQIDIPNNRHTASSTLATGDDNGMFILLTVITSSMRSSGRAASKIKACELLLAFGERLPDEAKLDRILPYVMPLLEDTNEMVLVAALRTMTQLLALVRVASPVNSFLFTQYIFPRLQTFVNSKGFKTNPIVRETYATCLASLAESASRFLDMVQALRAEGSLPSAEKGTENGIDPYSAYHDAYDATRLEVLEQFEGQTKVFLTDNDTAVRRAFLTSVPSLCVFFGEDRAADVLLSHLNTYLNDPDWQLKCAFFKTIVGVAVYIGGASLEVFILPLMLGALADPQEYVVEQALRSLASMAEIGLLQKPKTWELIDTISRFQVHPNMWIKEAAAHFVSAATAFLSVADVRILVTPLIQPYLKVPVSSLSELELLDALKKPLPRAVLDMALQWAQRGERGLFWKPARESKQLSYRATNNMPPVSSVADLGPRTMSRIPKTDEDEQWLGRLRNAGLRSEDEMKLLAFREYVWRAAQRSKREEPTPETPYDQLVSLTRLKITPQTVIFDNDLDTFESRMQAQTQTHSADRTIAEALEEAVTPSKEMPFRPLHLNGISDSPSASDTAGSSLPTPIAGEARRLSGLRQKPSGSLSSSPSSGINLLGRDGERNRSNAAGLLGGADLRNKSGANVATENVTAAGKLHTPVGSQPTSPAPQGQKKTERPAGHKAAHNYTGNDPTVLKLLDAVYVDNYPMDAAEFGPLMPPLKRGPIPSSSATVSAANWKPQGQLVAVLGEHTDRVSRIVVSPDHVFFLTGSDDGTVKVWDSSRIERNVTHRSRQTFRLPTGVKVTSLCFVEATHTFICTGSDGSLHVVKVDVTEVADTTRYGKLRELREWRIPSPADSGEHAVWSEHYRSDASSVLVLATNLNRIMGIDLRNMSIIFELHNPAQHGTPLTFCMSRKHDWILVGTSQGVLDLWDLRFHLKLRSWAFPNAAPITRLQLHPSRKTARRNRVCVAGGTARGEVTVWDIEKVICHEIYRPAHPHSKDRIHLRDYELRNLEEERSEGPLGRVAAQSQNSANANATSDNASVSCSSLYFGLHHPSDDSEALHAFALTGGPDGKVRFWDCDRTDGCRIVSSSTPDEGKPTYAYEQLGLDTRVLTEHAAPTGPGENSASDAGGGGKASPSKRGGQSAAAAGAKVSRYEVIRTSGQKLLGGHLDTVTDVALLERPFGMVVSADRAGQVFVYQ